ncbi:hypothetical protein [Pseudomonas fluorescens]|uniref:Uncharacterized protein n=1 Tax=Pseudomonas fluorescens TaxID=294 RepID=A0A5E7EG83_PSEFL|nr:hypothetical protein [Pseudomonas fluorescens]VVO25780.1 hypothetical protein PS691_04544 [Pseudomonas fluorescens]
MFDVNGSNLEQYTERFAAQLANPDRPVALGEAPSGLSSRWSMAGLLWAGIVACLLIQ